MAGPQLAQQEPGEQISPRLKTDLGPQREAVAATQVESTRADPGSSGLGTRDQIPEMTAEAALGPAGVGVRGSPRVPSSRLGWLGSCRAEVL